MQENNAENKPAKAVKLEFFPEIEEKLEKARRENDTELILLLNELTLARNLEVNKAQIKKEFRTVFVAFKSNGKVIKRAGVYNVSELSDPEQAEDILISEDFSDKRVIAVPRNSSFTI